MDTINTAIREGYNPYRAGGPVHEDKLLFGRENILKSILNTIHNNSILIYGERRIGKTSILFKLHRELAQLNNSTCTFYPVFISLQGTSEPKFFATLAQHIINACPLPPERTWTFALEEVTTYDLSGFLSDVKRIIQHLRTLASPPPKIVLLLDEIDTLNDYHLNTNLQLRTVFTGAFHDYFSAIMAGYALRENWPTQASPPFNYLSQRIEIGPLDEETARQLIEDPVKGFYHYTSDAMQRILDASELRPFLIQKLCLEAVNRMSQQNRREVSSEDVEFAIETVETMNAYLSPEAVNLTPEQQRLRELEEENARLKARLAAMETRSETTHSRN